MQVNVNTTGLRNYPRLIKVIERALKDATGGDISFLPNGAMCFCKDDRYAMGASA